MKFCFLIILLFIFHPELFCQCSCTPFQNTTSDSIQVSNVPQLVNAVQQANSTGNLTILLLNGTHQLSVPLFINGNNVTMRSKTSYRKVFFDQKNGVW
ncbi:MAG: hypothetical protein L0Y79_05685 [Chlorobi bacterium]|nr:hypothetical protein [Chlorobiota bacterium]MCI0715776.1 hypothetical protein [Chlorobiota bacterium]